jgi:predicted nucleotidyltransferase
MIAHGIDLNSEAIRDFCLKWKIRELSVFGSILREDFRPDSDVDFLADYEEGAGWDLFDHMDMEEELAGIVGRDVDLLTKYSVETSQNRFYKKEILSTAEPVFAPR